MPFPFKICVYFLKRIFKTENGQIFILLKSLSRSTLNLTQTHQQRRRVYCLHFISFHLFFYYFLFALYIFFTVCIFFILFAVFFSQQYAYLQFLSDDMHSGALQKLYIQCLRLSLVFYVLFFYLFCMFFFNFFFRLPA